MTHLRRSVRVASHHVGSVTPNLSTGKAEGAGYLTHSGPISGSLINGAASKNPAFFKQ